MRSPSRSAWRPVPVAVRRTRQAFTYYNPAIAILYASVLTWKSSPPCTPPGGKMSLALFLPDEHVSAELLNGVQPHSTTRVFQYNSSYPVGMLPKPPRAYLLVSLSPCNMGPFASLCEALEPRLVSLASVQYCNTCTPCYQERLSTPCATPPRTFPAQTK